LIPFRSPIHSDVPVLFISGTQDLNTPASNAAEVARGFRHAAQLVIEGAAHSDPLILSSPEILKRMLAFLAASGEIPAAPASHGHRLLADCGVTVRGSTPPFDLGERLGHIGDPHAGDNGREYALVQDPVSTWISVRTWPSRPHHR